MRAFGLLLVLVVIGVVASSAADQESMIDVIVGLRQRNLDRLDALFWAVSDPSDPQYAQYQTRDQLRELLEPAPFDVARVKTWLSVYGAATEIVLQASGDFIRARVPTTEHVDALTARRAEIDDLIDSFVPLIPDPNAGEREFSAGLQWRKLAYKNVAAGDATGDPNTQKAAYGIPTNLQATNPNHNQMVWGTGTYGYLPSDLSKFYSDWGLPASNTGHLFAAGGFAGTPGGDNFGEATLDITYASSMALGLTSYVSNTNNASNTEWSTGFGTAMYAFFSALAVGSSVPTVLSLSLGSLSWDSCNLLCTQVPVVSNGTFTVAECQQYMTSQRQVCMYPDSGQIDRMNTEFQKLAVRGVSIFAASGDGGSHFSFQEFPTDPLGSVLNEISCAFNLPTYPSESPFVTSVGGTQWSISPTQPIAWTASGGGFSWRSPVPPYQQQAVLSYLSQASANGQLPPESSYNASNRAYPDVAALANGVPMVVQGMETETGGTSASAPEFAGIISLINDQRLNQGLKPLGFINPRIYALNAQYPGVLFYDMSTGNSNCGADGYCCATGFPALPGFDVTTGLGSPLWPGLSKYLTAAP